MVQLLSCIWLFVTPWTIAPHASLSLTISQRLLKFVSIELVMPSHPQKEKVTPFSSCPPSFPASGSFPKSPLFESCGQNFGVSALASVLLMNIQGWFPLGLTGLISLQFMGLSKFLWYYRSKASHLSFPIKVLLYWKPMFAGFRIAVQPSFQALPLVNQTACLALAWRDQVLSATWLILQGGLIRSLCFIQWMDK